jgi:hypothetical protein
MSEQTTIHTQFTTGADTSGLDRVRNALAGLTQSGIPQTAADLENLFAAFAGAGVAGAAIATLGPLVLQLVDDLGVLDDALGKTQAKLNDDANAAAAAYAATLDKAGQSARAFQEALAGEGRAVEEANKAIERQLKLLESKQRIQAMLEDATLAANIEDIKAQGMAPADEARAIANAKLQSSDRKAADEEKARAAQMAAAAGVIRNNAIGYNAATDRFNAAQKQTQQAGLFEYNQAEIAKLQPQLAGKQAAAATTSPGSYRGDELRAEVERLKGEIARREKANADILAANNGYAPTGYSKEQLSALQAQIPDAKARFDASVSQANDLATSQAAARQEDAMRRAIEAQAINRDFTAAQFPGVPMFNSPATGADFTRRTGRPAVSPVSPGAVPPAPIGSPLDSAALAPLTQAAQTIQGSPLDVSPLATALQGLGDAVTTQRDDVQKQLAEQAKRLEQIAAQLKNSR